MAYVQPNNITSGRSQDFHQDGSVKLSIEDTIQTTNTQMGFSDDGRLRISPDIPIIMDTIEGTTLNTNIWQTSLSTMTVAQANGVISLNAGASTALGAYAILQSNKQALKYMGNAWFYQGVLQFIPSNLAAVSPGTICEIGMANFSGAAAVVTDGIFVRQAASGDVYLVQSFNGQEDATELVLPGGPKFVPTPGDFYLIEMLITDEHIHVEIVNIGTTTEDAGTTTLVSQSVTFLSTRPSAISVSHLPIAARMYNLVAPVTAMIFNIGSQELSQLDTINQRSMGEWLTVNAKGAYQGPNTTAGLTQTANHANSTSPASATLSNTAAGYTTLGGRYQFATVAGAATDFALFGYQVPAGNDLIITGLRISAMNTGAAVAATATILDWSIAVNSSAVSLATAEGAGTWAPRRIAVGMQGFIVAAGIGASANDIIVQFATPIVANGGRFVHIILQLPVGTATASQIVRGDVMINGYFE